MPVHENAVLNGLRLTHRYEKNGRMKEKSVWQDKKDFTLHVPVNAQNDGVYFKGMKKDVPDGNLFKETKNNLKRSWCRPVSPGMVQQSRFSLLQRG